MIEKPVIERFEKVVKEFNKRYTSAINRVKRITNGIFIISTIIKSSYIL